MAGAGEAVAPLPEDLSDVLRHLESCYPDEGCGVLLLAEGEGRWRMCPLRNALTAVPAPRSPRTAYAFDPSEWLQVLLDAERRGERLMCVFHSHVDGGVDFSPEDRHQAAPGGEPLLPGVSYLVVAVRSGRAGETALYRWSGHTFLRAPLRAGPASPSEAPSRREIP